MIRFHNKRGLGPCNIHNVTNLGQREMSSVVRVLIIRVPHNPPLLYCELSHVKHEKTCARAVCVKQETQCVRSIEKLSALS